MNVITHPNFTKKRNEIEDHLFDDFHALVSEYINFVETYLIENDSAHLRNMLNLFVFIYEDSKHLPETLDQRALYAKIVHASMNLLNCTIEEFQSLKERKEKFSLQQVREKLHAIMEEGDLRAR